MTNREYLQTMALIRSAAQLVTMADVEGALGEMQTGAERFFQGHPNAPEAALRRWQNDAAVLHATAAFKAALRPIIDRELDAAEARETERGATTPVS